MRAAGADTVAAFIAEPVGGSSTGAAVPAPDYFRTVREICIVTTSSSWRTKSLCGAGRTGTWWAIEPFGVVPGPHDDRQGDRGWLCAAVGRRRAAPHRRRAGRGHRGPLSHAQTFSFHPVACAAGLATVRYLKAHRLVERCAELGAVFHAKLAA